MNNLLKISSFVLCSGFLLGSCTLDKMVLDDRDQLAVAEDPEKGMPVLKYNKGVIDDFSGEIYSWWVANEQVGLSRKGDTLKAVLKNVGPKWECFGKQFNLLDMTEAPVFRVKMRVEGATAPNISLHFKDMNGYDANAAPPTIKVPKNAPYDYYYFNFKDKWKQGWPDTKKVDETTITEILIFINGGGSPFTGTLFIDEIVAVRVEDMPEAGPAADGGMIDEFTDPLDPWWAADKIGLKQEGEQMLVISTGAGASYECFGRAFQAMNFAKSGIVRIKARSEGTDLPVLRVDMKDSEGRVTNASPVSNKIETGELKDYFYNFTGKYTQVWPDAQTVKAEEIKDILLFINAGGPPYEGKIYIEEIEVITEARYNELMGLAPTENNNTTASAGGSNIITIDNFNEEIYSWWSNAEKMKLTKEGDKMKVELKNVGPGYEPFGRAFKNINFNQTPVVKVRAKADKDLQLRVDVKDENGRSTNAQAIVQQLAAGDFVDLYFDFTGKYSQSYPDNQVVDPTKITEILFFVNPGGAGFTGTLIIDEVKAMTTEDAKNKK
ncbi:MAG: hypothetical protein ACK40G_03120 [Cytophagaceae bacterium]